MKTNACKYGFILPFNSLSNRNGIGRGNMGDHVSRAGRHQAHFSNRQALAELEKPRLRQQVVPGRALAQEVDVEIGGHRQTDGADRRKQHDIHGEIGERHQRRTGNRPTRPQHLLAVTLPEPTRGAVSRFNPNVSGGKGLRKFPPEELLQFRHRHFCNRHAPRLPSPLRASYIRLMAIAQPANDISMISQTARAAVSQPQILLRENVGDIAVLTLNRPESRNSLSAGLIAALDSALREIRDDRAVRAVVITATGSAFSAGHDMKELTARRGDPDRGRAYFAEMMTKCSTMMQAIVHLPKPVVAAVQGIATAAGCQLVATCDLAVASEAASFATPGVDIGLFCSTPMVALSRNIPRKQAMEMLLTGEPISATTARDIGLVNRVVPAGSERNEAIALAQKVARKSAYTVKIGKAAFHRQAEMNLADAYAYAAEVMTENMMARDAEEGIGAFIEKREPKWQDK